jgi:hypothetical protein
LLIKLRANQRPAVDRPPLRYPRCGVPIEQKNPNLLKRGLKYLKLALAIIPPIL